MNLWWLANSQYNIPNLHVLQHDNFENFWMVLMICPFLRQALGTESRANVKIIYFENLTKSRSKTETQSFELIFYISKKDVPRWYRNQCIAPLIKRKRINRRKRLNFVTQFCERFKTKKYYLHFRTSPSKYNLPTFAKDGRNSLLYFFSELLTT